jgi:hypothetical protein
VKKDSKTIKKVAESWNKKHWGFYDLQFGKRDEQIRKMAKLNPKLLK